MTYLTPGQLNNYCLSYLEAIHPFDNLLWDFSTNQYNTGLRFMELYLITNWLYVTDEHIICYTSKDSYDRIFTKDELTPFFYENVKDHFNDYEKYSFTTYNRYFNRYFPVYKIYHLTRPLASHLFRHNIAKQLKLLGQTDIEIQEYLGEKYLGNAQNYIYSELHIG